MKKVLIYVDKSIFNVSEITLTAGSEKEFDLINGIDGDLVVSYDKGNGLKRAIGLVILK